jgi:hypothetical protein
MRTRQALAVRKRCDTARGTWKVPKTAHFLNQLLLELVVVARLTKFQAVFFTKGKFCDFENGFLLTLSFTLP